MVKKKAGTGINKLFDDALVKEDEQSYNVPTNWVWVRLGSFADVKGGKRLPQGHKLTDSTTQYPYIRVINFENLSIDVKNLKYLKKETAKLISNYTISSDDIYISIAGTIGKVGSVQEELSGANLTENAAKITNFEPLNNGSLTESVGKK